MAEDPAQLVESAARVFTQKIIEAEAAGDSDIQQFFIGSVIFITGGTGFVGKQLVEKLFRACRGIEKIYLLCRSKRGKTSSERITKQLKDPVYDEVKKVNPEFHKRIHLVEGDVTELRLGLRNEDWKKLCDEVNFIFHVAATVRFNEPLKSSVLTNVRGTREILNLAKECLKLRSIVYVSTAYAHCNRSSIAEKFYPSPVAPNTLIEMIETMDDKRIEALCPALLSDWPNTYTFSKALAEDLVRTMGQDLPICIVRPAIVTPTYREPTPGWLDLGNVNGPSGIVLGTGLGILHTLLTNKKSRTDLVPLDYTNNLIIAASWSTAQRHARAETGTKIYTLSRKRNVQLWSDTENYMANKARSLVSPKTVWYCYCVKTSNTRLFRIYTILIHYIPALFVDAILATMGYKIRLLKVYQKIYKMTILLLYFILQSWTFHDDNTLDLYNSLSKKDQQIFSFDVTNISIPDFMANWCIGVRKYIINDNLQGTNVAVKRQFWFKIANFLLVILYFISLWKVTTWIYYVAKWFILLVI